MYIVTDWSNKAISNPVPINVRTQIPLVKTTGDSCKSNAGTTVIDR